MPDLTKTANELTRLASAIFRFIVTLNLFQGPFLRLLRLALNAPWMLKRVQHDEGKSV
jgi:hypothetical protein